MENAATAAADPVRIEIARGSYTALISGPAEPVVEKAPVASAGPTKRLLWVSASVALLLLVGVRTLGSARCRRRSPSLPPPEPWPATPASGPEPRQS